MTLPDIHLVLSDWFDGRWSDTSGFSETGYHTFHFANTPHSSTSLCGSDGLAYEYYSSLLSHEDDFLCLKCISIAAELFRQLIGDNGELL